MKDLLRNIFPKNKTQTDYLRFLETSNMKISTPYIRAMEQEWENIIKSLETPYLQLLKHIEEEK